MGGANSAGQAAVFFSEYAWPCHHPVPGVSLRDKMSAYLVEQIAARRQHRGALPEPGCRGFRASRDSSGSR